MAVVVLLHSLSGAAAVAYAAVAVAVQVLVALTLLAVGRCGLYPSCISGCCCCRGHSGGGGGAVTFPLRCCCRDAYTAVAATVQVMVAVTHLVLRRRGAVPHLLLGLLLSW
jgi:hypothetical protein